MDLSGQLLVRQHKVELPVFLPDATRAGVRGVASSDLREIGVEALMVNTFHLMRRPGIRVVQRIGGVRRFMAWDGPVMSDSGGFQVFSLIRENPANGTIRPNEVIFREPETKQKWLLTPEKCVQLQFQMGSDIIVCLDDCTAPSEAIEQQMLSVERTVKWARRCKDEFNSFVERAALGEMRPLIFAVVQGGASFELRRQCAAALADIGFDGYGFGGWPIAPDGTLHSDLLEVVSSSVPRDSLRHALGIGRPDHVVTAASLGYNMFDCTLPARDARHHRLYIFRNEYVNKELRPGDDFYERLYILDEKYHASKLPLEETCDCPCCLNYSRAYVHHLFKVKDATAERLASLHNLRFYVRLINKLRAGDRAKVSAAIS